MFCKALPLCVRLRFKKNWLLPPGNPLAGPRVGSLLRRRALLDVRDEPRAPGVPQAARVGAGAAAGVNDDLREGARRCVHAAAAALPAHWPALRAGGARARLVHALC